MSKEQDIPENDEVKNNNPPLINEKLFLQIAGETETDENLLGYADAKSQISNNILENENMEVHKHPHHVTHKKKWTEYLLEFLMIFLAVCLGFIGENIRENADMQLRDEIASRAVNLIALNKKQYHLFPG